MGLDLQPDGLTVGLLDTASPTKISMVSKSLQV